jgi:tetratricopeptide (TPR) repeat protein
LPPPKWWGKYVLAGNPPERRFVIRWRNVLAILGSLALVAYLGLATALWGYYSMYRHIPGVHWIDVAVLPRVPRVQAAIGDSYFTNAQDQWQKKDYLHAIFTARAAVQKNPNNLDARLFLAERWRLVGRIEEAIRTLRGGIPHNAADPRLQQAAIGVALETGHYRDVLQFLREDFPKYGVSLLAGPNPDYQLAEIRAVLETAGPAQAFAASQRYPQLNSLPQAAPLLAGIELQLGRGPAALERLRAARAQRPKDPSIVSAFISTAKSNGRMDEAKAGARQYLTDFPTSVDAQLTFIEMFGSRQGDDRLPWAAAGMTFLSTHRREPEVLARLASLAAAQGWTDITYLLYENSLQESLNGMPFAIYYAASLVKAGDPAGADAVWHELAVRNGAQIAGASYVEAMIASGNGRVSETNQIIDRLRRETKDDPARRHTLESVFRTFGYPRIAELLAADHA